MRHGPRTRPGVTKSEVARQEPHPPERLAETKAALARMAAEGGPEIID